MFTNYFRNKTITIKLATKVGLLREKKLSLKTETYIVFIRYKLFLFMLYKKNVIRF